MLTGVSEITYSNTASYSLQNSENLLVNRIFGNRSYNAVNFGENIFTSGVGTTSVNTETTKNITVDAIGNMLTYGDTSFGWNGRQLASISDEETVLSYEYNTDGQRIKKIYSSADGEILYTFEYFYCGDILAGEKFIPNSEYIDEEPFTVTYMFDENGEYFGFIHNGTPYYYVKNAQNDVYLIIDENGVAQVLYQYDAWGKITNCVDASGKNLATANPITYRSYHYEFETGYYFLSTRYYSPEFHRFINADSVVSEIGGDQLGYIYLHIVRITLSI